MNAKRISQQLRSFERLLEAYHGREPLSRFLTGFFKENKQMGSNDRRTMSRWIYNYFRIGNSVCSLPPIERLVIAEYLCNEDSDLVSLLNPSLNNTIAQPLEKKIASLDTYGFDSEDLFPLINSASSDLDKTLFLQSLFRQPDLFIRIHPAYKEFVLDRLEKHAFAYKVLDTFCVSLPNGTKLDQDAELRGKYEVQDLSSQQTVRYFKAKTGDSWWDACAASGGKSILLLQHFLGVKVLVSDIRSSILRNLDERFDKAGIKQYRKKIIDLTKDPTIILGTETFDGIILDMPCSGSGTWGRTPEMMKLFTRERLQYFVELQREILANILQHLKPGAPLVYITCSMYKNENEEQVAFAETKGLKLEQMELLKGYLHRADTMFVARLTKK